METQLTRETLNIEPSSSLKQPPGCAGDSVTLFKPEKKIVNFASNSYFASFLSSEMYSHGFYITPYIKI